MNGGEWLLAVRPLDFLIRSRVPNVEKKFDQLEKALDKLVSLGYNESIKNEAG